MSTYHLSIQCLDLLCWRQKEALSQRRRRAERPMRAAILRAPPGAGKASSHATTRADPCRELPAPGVDNLSLTLITSRDQSEQKPETRTQIPFRFRGSHLKKNRRGYTCSLAGMSSLGRSGRCLHTAETRPTGRSHGKSRRVSQKTDPRKNRARRRNRPTPGFSAMGNRQGKPQQKPYGKITLRQQNSVRLQLCDVESGRAAGGGTDVR